MTAALILLTGLTILIGLALLAASGGQTDQATVADAIDNVLPQTQCAQCGYSGCRPYADAIVSGAADINQCPPGGKALIRELSLMLGRDIKPLDPLHGIEKAREIAEIDEDICIGCKKCIQVCPVDAILGAPKLMHTVIAGECTGCDLCAPVCPVDCIAMVPAVTGIPAWQLPAPACEPVVRV